MFGLIIVMCVTSCIDIKLLPFIEAANITDIDDALDKTLAVMLDERIKYLSKAKTNTVNKTWDENTSDSFKTNLTNYDIEPNRRYIVTTGKYSDITSDIIKINYKNVKRLSEHKRSTSDSIKTNLKSYELEPNRPFIVTTGKYSDISFDIIKRNYKNTKRLSEYKRSTLNTLKTSSEIYELEPNRQFIVTTDKYSDSIKRFNDNKSSDIVERYYKRADRIRINFESKKTKRPKDAGRGHKNSEEYTNMKEQQILKQYLGLRQHLAPDQPSSGNQSQKKHLTYLFPRELFSPTNNQSQKKNQTLKDITANKFNPVQLPVQQHVNSKNHSVEKDHTGPKNQNVKTKNRLKEQPVQSNLRPKEPNNPKAVYQPKEQPVPTNVNPKEPHKPKEQTIKRKQHPQKHIHPKYPDWATYPRPGATLKSEYFDPKQKDPIKLAAREHLDQTELRNPNERNPNDYDDPKQQQGHYVIKKELNWAAYPGPRQRLESKEHAKERNKVHKRLPKPIYSKNKAKKVTSKGKTEEIKDTLNATTQFVDLMAYTVLKFLQADKHNISDNPKLIRISGNQEKPSVILRLDPHTFLGVLKNVLKPNNNLQRMLNVFDKQDNGTKFEDNT